MRISAGGLALDIGKFDPGRRVIAGLLPAANLAIDLRRYEAAGKRWAKQQVIDPQPGVPP